MADRANGQCLPSRVIGMWTPINAGAFVVVLEAIPHRLAEYITARLVNTRRQPRPLRRANTSSAELSASQRTSISGPQGGQHPPRPQVPPISASTNATPSAPRRARIGSGAEQAESLLHLAFPQTTPEQRRVARRRARVGAYAEERQRRAHGPYHATAPQGHAHSPNHDSYDAPTQPWEALQWFCTEYLISTNSLQGAWYTNDKAEIIPIISALHRAGARNFLCIDVPSLYMSPIGASMGDKGVRFGNWNELRRDFTFAMGQPDATVMLFSGRDMSSHILADPARYGLNPTDRNIIQGLSGPILCTQHPAFITFLWMKSHNSGPPCRPKLDGFAPPAPL
ncbi:hypothetical protein BJV78DRAFT_1361946 [Lactifluus subvellereus]|nr:hypothetical protein BJV78DRAFT_1361946 [Lactifluus subvellereus]